MLIVDFMALQCVHGCIIYSYKYGVGKCVMQRFHIKWLWIPVPEVSSFKIFAYAFSTSSYGSSQNICVIYMYICIFRIPIQGYSSWICMLCCEV
jgi:hypothetical protein